MRVGSPLQDLMVWCFPFPGALPRALAETPRWGSTPAKTRPVPRPEGATQLQPGATPRDHRRPSQSSPEGAAQSTIWRRRPGGRPVGDRNSGSSFQPIPENDHVGRVEYSTRWMASRSCHFSLDGPPVAGADWSSASDSPSRRISDRTEAVGRGGGAHRA